jgi:hypothetical protein
MKVTPSVEESVEGSRDESGRIEPGTAKKEVTEARQQSRQTLKNGTIVDN